MWRYTHDGSRRTNQESRPEYFQKYFFGASLHVSSMRHMLQDAAKQVIGSTVGGGQNPRINGAGVKTGTKYAVGSTVANKG